MNVFMITNDVPPLIGGVATHVWELSKALAKQGHQVTVVTASRAIYNRSRFCLREVKEYYGFKVVHLGAFGIFRRWQWHQAVARFVRKIDRSQQRDSVIHLHSFHSPPLIRPLTNLPIIWTNHTSEFLLRFEDPNCRSKLEDIVHSCDWITAPSMELLDKALEFGYPKETATYIPNGVDVERFQPCSSQTTSDSSVVISNHEIKRSNEPNEQCIVLCARRFAFKNGIHVYLDALESLDDEALKRCIFLFAGNVDGDQDPSSYNSQMTKRVHDLAKRADCRLLGGVNNEVIQDLYRVSDVSVLPSLREATSITGLESMACGLPIVGCAVGGIPEIVESGVTGLLCAPDDPRAFATHLRTLIMSPDMRAKFGEAARDRAVASFSWSIVASRFCDVYEASLEQKRSSAT